MLHPGEFVLGSTYERVTLGIDLVGRLDGKSSLGRLGLLIHSTAGFIDPGFDGHITLELSNVASLPITLYPGMRIGQISFLAMTTAADHPVRQRPARLQVPGPARAHAQPLPRELQASLTSTGAPTPPARQNGPGHLERHAAPHRADRAPLGREVHAVAGRVEGDAGQLALRGGRPPGRTPRPRRMARCMQISGSSGRPIERPGPRTRRCRRCCARRCCRRPGARGSGGPPVVDHPDLSGCRCVVGPDPVVALRREVHDAAAEPDALAALELGGARRPACGSGVVRGRRVGHRQPARRPVLHPRRLEHAGREVLRSVRSGTGRRGRDTASSVMYTVRLAPSTAAPSWLNRPMAEPGDRRPARPTDPPPTPGRCRSPRTTATCPTGCARRRSSGWCR